MNIIAIFGLGSLKVLLMLLIAAGVALALRGRPARLRAVIWGTALIGSLLIPLAAAVVPALPVVVPVEIPRLSSADPGLSPVDEIRSVHRDRSMTTAVAGDIRQFQQKPAEGWRIPSLDTLLVTIWAGIAMVFLGHQFSGLWRMVGIIRRARPVTDENVLDLAADVCAQIGCRRRVRLVTSSELDIPAVCGIFRPVVILPIHSRTWLDDRLTAVFQHELIHLIRLDWPIRMAARFACAIYWFNPLVWWAKRRLDLEQEMACDEEVLSLGSRASSYACHLLGIARTAIHRPTLAAAGLEMARRSDLEERIMRILNRSKHRKVGLAVILPAAILTAALVPAIAAVQPTEPGPREASPELKDAMAEMREAEKKLEPYIARITAREIEMEPILEKIEDIEIDIDHSAFDAIHAQMEPILAQIKDVKIDMEPYHEQMEAFAEAMGSMTFHIEDGTMDEIHKQIEEQMREVHINMESIHIDMDAYHDQLEALHEQLEPMHEEISRMARENMPSHEEIERLHAEALEPMQEELERIHREIGPLHEEVELMGERIERAIQNDVAAVLRSHLGSVTSPAAPFSEAAARIVEESNIHIDDDVLELDVSRREAREILADLFSPSRIGTQAAFDAALEAAVDDISDLEISTD